MPSPDTPRSLSEAASKVRDWLSVENRWIQRGWINTPDGAYAGNCSACLHGAAIYIGGPFGPALSDALTDAGFNIQWNDDDSRTLDDVLKALDSLAH